MTDRQTESLLVSEREAARLLPVSPATLRAWRRVGRGPGAVRLGRAVRYAREALAAYITRCTEGGQRTEALS
jgi:predicted DNA-binding transcriptional regulator AlpA